MIMLGLWFTDEVPFKVVYLHGLVRDKLGRKISKTLGNVIDPLVLMDQYGADPLRFALVTGSTPGNDINLDEARVERNWRFVNKLWQMTNFVTSNLTDEAQPEFPGPTELDLPTRWILSRLNGLVSTVQRLFDTYQYGEAGRQIDDFLWGEFADWYIEISKRALYTGTDAEKAVARHILVHVLETGLRLLHPFMPFVTEEAWQYLPNSGMALITAKWPQANTQYVDEEAERKMSTLIDLVRGIRNVREEYKVEPGRKIDAAAAAPEEVLVLLEEYDYFFTRLCNIGTLSFQRSGSVSPAQAATVTVGETTIFLPLAGLVDIAGECDRLGKELARLNEQVARSQAMLANDQFVQRARPDVVERERVKLHDLQAEVTQITERLAEMC